LSRRNRKKSSQGPSGLICRTLFCLAVAAGTVSAQNFSLSKEGPTSATAGTDVTWHITATDFNQTTLNNVSITDVIPAGMTFVSAVQSAGGTDTFSCSNVSGTVTCTVASIPPHLPLGLSENEFDFTFHISPDVPDGTVITNTVTISGTNVATNSQPALPLTVNNVSDVSVTKSAPATATAGTNLTYSIGVANSGPSSAPNVSLTDALPAGLSFVSMVQNTGQAFNCGFAAGTVTCTNVSMTPGAATFTLTALVSPTVVNGTVISNTASVSPTDATPGDNSATGTSTIGVSADVSIAKAGPATVDPGKQATYTITVSNAGPSQAGGVTASDTLPANTSFVSALPSQGSCSGTSTVTCSLGTIAASGSATITLKVTVNSGPSVSNTATVTTTTSDPNAGNNSSTATAAVAPPSIPALSTLGLVLLALAIAGARSLALRRARS